MYFHIISTYVVWLNMRSLDIFIYIIFSSKIICIDLPFHLHRSGGETVNRFVNNELSGKKYQMSKMTCLYVVQIESIFYGCFLYAIVSCNSFMIGLSNHRLHLDFLLWLWPSDKATQFTMVIHIQGYVLYCSFRKVQQGIYLPMMFQINCT